MEKTLITIIIATLLSACAGRTANPVSSYQVGDSAMNCEELTAEMAHIDNQVAKLIPDSKKTGKNVALGVAGWFLLVPWFFMDFSDAEKVEINAYNQRYMSLQKQAIKKEC